MSLQELKTISGNSTDAEILHNTLHKKLKSSNEQTKPQPNKGYRATMNRKRFKYSNPKSK